MNTFEQRVEKNIPSLVTFATDLCDLAEKVLNKIQTNDDDHFGIMCLCFLSKQRDHLKTIVSLTQNRDSELIARSMLEGLAQLVWTAQETRKTEHIIGENFLLSMTIVF